MYNYIDNLIIIMLCAPICSNFEQKQHFFRDEIHYMLENYGCFNQNVNIYIIL